MTVAEKKVLDAKNAEAAKLAAEQEAAKLAEAQAAKLAEEEAAKKAEEDAKLAEPTSEALTAIDAKIDAKIDEQMAAAADKKAYLKLGLEIYNLGQERIKELANIAKEKQAAEKKELENIRLSFGKTYGELMKEQGIFEATTDHAAPDYLAVSNELNDRVKASWEKLSNELLAKFGTGTASKSVATGTTATSTGAPKGATSAVIVEMFIANRAAGMTDTENKKAIIAAGYNDGTVGNAVIAWQRSTGEKPPKA